MFGANDSESELEAANKKAAEAEKASNVLRFFLGDVLPLARKAEACRREHDVLCLVIKCKQDNVAESEYTKLLEDLGPTFHQRWVDWVQQYSISLKEEESVQIEAVIRNDKKLWQSYWQRQLVELEVLQSAALVSTKQLDKEKCEMERKGEWNLLVGAERQCSAPSLKDMDLMTLCEQGDVEQVKKCIGLSQGWFSWLWTADNIVNVPDKDGRFALSVACFFGHVDLVKYLLKIGANPGATSNVPNFYTCTQWTIKGEAFSSGKGEEILDLFESQDILLPGFIGRTALHTACMTRNIECVNYLLVRGHPVDVVESEQGKRSALHVAAGQGFTAGVRALLEAWAHTELVDACGNRAVVEAAICCKAECLRAFLSFGVFLRDEEIKVLRKVKHWQKIKDSIVESLSMVTKQLSDEKTF